MSVSHAISPKKLRDVHLRLAFTEQQLHAGLDEFRVCNEFENNCGTVSRPQQVLWMVDGNDTVSVRVMQAICDTVQLANEASIRSAI